MGCREIGRGIKRRLRLQLSSFGLARRTIPTGPPALSMREERSVLRMKSISCKTAKGIADEDQDEERLQWLLQKSRNVARIKMRRKPVLSERHNMARMAEQVTPWTDDWNNGIFL